MPGGALTGSARTPRAVIVEFAASLRKTVALCREFQSGEMPKPLSDQARADLDETAERIVAA